MNKSELLSKLLYLYVDLANLEVYDGVEEYVSEYAEKQMKLKKEIQEGYLRENNIEQLLKNAFEVNEYLNGYRQFDRQMFDKHKELLDEKYLTKEKVWFILCALSSGKAETLEEAVRLLENDSPAV